MFKITSLSTIGKMALLFVILGLLCWLALGQYLHARREPAAYRALSHICTDNVQQLAEVCKQYQTMHGTWPPNIRALIPLATNRRWIFSCALIDNPKFELLIDPPPIQQMRDVSPPIRITYLYFTNAVQGVRLICPAWQEGLTAIDATGEVIKVDREKWQTLKQALSNCYRPN